MGLLIEGVWHDQWYDTESTGGKFERKASQYRNRISEDGSGDFPAQADRYHLYVSLACPWAHRTIICRRIKKLENVISMSVVDPYMGEHGWSFFNEAGDARSEDATADHLYDKKYLHEVYCVADPQYTGRVTVPVLWDKHTQTIVNNESSEILRMLNSAFNAFTDSDIDLYPQALRTQIDEINDFVYPKINNGVYRCGFATQQLAYNEAFDELFAALDQLDQQLGTQRYLVGEQITEADWRLFTTLIRFDAVYHGHFKCNRRRIADYENLSGYLRELYQYPRVKETVNFTHIKEHYYRSHSTINPTRIVPRGPALDYSTPHNREHLSTGI